MPRDPRKLRVFALADGLVPEIYGATKSFPTEERFGLVSQLRRAAVSVPANIVEGCGRRKTNDYLHFLNIATGSAYELGYLLGVIRKTRDDAREGRRRSAGHVRSHCREPHSVDRFA